jgi:hypothetical protein
MEESNNLVGSILVIFVIAIIGILVISTMIGGSGSENTEQFTVYDPSSDTDCTLDKNPTGGVSLVECYMGLTWTTVDPGDYSVAGNVVTVSSTIWS